jgi:anti-sigma factor RsiW
VIEIHESTGCYALDALDQPELAAFEAHLDICCSCGHEIAEFYETAAELALLTATLPPQALRETVLSAVRSTPQLPTSRPVDRQVARPGSQAAHLGGTRQALPGAKVREAYEPPRIEQLALHRQWRRNRLFTGAVAAMLALLVGLGGVVYSQFQQRQAQLAQINQENALYRAADTETAVVAVSGGGQATFVVSRQLDRALFVGAGLPDPGPGDRYTLWTATGTSVKAPTGFSMDNQVSWRRSRSKQFFRGDISHVDVLALNVERAGSTPAAPTTPILAAARI